MRITSSKWKQSLETTSQDLQEPTLPIEPQHEKEEALTTYFFCHFQQKSIRRSRTGIKLYYFCTDKVFKLIHEHWLH